MSDAWLLHCAFGPLPGAACRDAVPWCSPWVGRAVRVPPHNEFSGMALKQFDFSKCTFGDCVFDDYKTGVDFAAWP